MKCDTDRESNRFSAPRSHFITTIIIPQTGIAWIAKRVTVMTTAQEDEQQQQSMQQKDGVTVIGVLRMIR